MKQKEPIQMRRWRRMWLLLLVCLLGSISPSWADTWHFQGSSEHVVVNSRICSLLPCILTKLKVRRRITTDFSLLQTSRAEHPLLPPTVRHSLSMASMPVRPLMSYWLVTTELVLPGMHVVPTDGGVARIMLLSTTSSTPSSSIIPITLVAVNAVW